VGFAIYKLRRFVGKAFDVYFHLWSNGAPHWEREKRIWEAEEAKKWSLVLSKKQKRVSNPLEKRKKVRFAEKIVQNSPVHKSHPIEVPQSVKIGSFSIDLSDSLKQAKVVKSISGILKATFSTESSCSSESDHGSQSAGILNPNSKFIWKQKSSSKGVPQGTVEQATTPRVTRRNSFPHAASPSSLNCSANYSWELNRIRRLRGCVRCININHSKSNCSFSLRCATCFKPGHKFKFCLTKSKPNVFWRPKSVDAQPSPDTQRSSEFQESDAYSVPPPNQAPATDNPTPHSKHPASEATHHCCQSSSSPLEDAMANFPVNPDPFVPDGLGIEDWARPARGRIIISDNPPRHHDEYSIITLNPPLLRIRFMMQWRRLWIFLRMCIMPPFGLAACPRLGYAWCSFLPPLKDK
jgi:hypothetical protein